MPNFMTKEASDVFSLELNLYGMNKVKLKVPDNDLLCYQNFLISYGTIRNEIISIFAMVLIAVMLIYVVYKLYINFIGFCKSRNARNVFTIRTLRAQRAGKNVNAKSNNNIKNSFAANFYPFGSNLPRPFFAEIKRQQVAFLCVFCVHVT